MARTIRKNAGDSAVTAADRLVERQPADGAPGPTTAPSVSKSLGDEDRSLANIHTGGRAVHQAANMTHEAGSPHPLAEAPPVNLHGPGGRVPADEFASADRTAAAAGSASGAAHADIVPAEGRQQVGANA